MKMIDENKLSTLLHYLKEAELLAKQFRGGHSNDFVGAENFHYALAQSINQLKLGDFQQMEKLYFWFAPTCDWDDFIGLEGVDLGNTIFELLCEIKEQETSGNTRLGIIAKDLSNPNFSSHENILYSPKQLSSL